MGQERIQKGHSKGPNTSSLTIAYSERPIEITLGSLGSVVARILHWRGPSGIANTRICEFNVIMMRL